MCSNYLVRGNQIVETSSGHVFLGMTKQWMWPRKQWEKGGMFYTIINMTINNDSIQYYYRDNLSKYRVIFQ